METDIKVKTKRAKAKPAVVADVALADTSKVVPSVVPDVVAKVAQNVVYEEPHHGKLLAVIIVGTLAIIAAIVGTFSLSGGTKNAGVPAVVNTGVVATTTPAPVIVPTEAFVITDTTANKAPSSSLETMSTKGSATVEQLAPSNFKAFSYDASVGKNISVSGTCHDAYYALLIFDSKDDYRTNPGAARANRAFECGATGLFTIKMDLRDINLPSGEYYLFVADQGKTGSWYNPR